MVCTKDPLPDGLEKIKQQVHAASLPKANINVFEPVWQSHVQEAGQIIPDICIESSGETLYLGELSPGCGACKQGAWDCVFITMACNLDCDFCLSPKVPSKGFTGSVFGNQPDKIIECYAKTNISGVSFSGGEPFLDEKKLFEWMAWYRKQFPEKYYWVYTNGLLPNRSHFERLAALGINEIRFNMAATGYDHPAVMKNLALAACYISNTTVEIPAIPEHAPKLMTCLSQWSDAGVKFLNMHELTHEKGTNSESIPGQQQTIIFSDGHCCNVNMQSRKLTLAVMRKIYDDGIPMGVNDCSMQSKIRQLRGRRACMAPLVKTGFENLVDGHFLERHCAYKGDEVHFFPSFFMNEMRQQYSNYQFARLTRIAPLNLRDPGKWICFEEI